MQQNIGASSFLNSHSLNKILVEIASHAKVKLMFEHVYLNGGMDKMNKQWNQEANDEDQLLSQSV